MLNKIKNEVSMKKTTKIFSELLILFLIIGLSIVLLGAEISEKNKTSDVQVNAVNNNETGIPPKLESAPINTNVSDNISTDSKISTALSSKITGASANEEIPVIIMLTDQKIAFNSINGKSQIEREQKNIINILENARSDNNAKNIKSIKIINAVAAKVTPEVIASLAKMPEVSVIEPDEVVHIAESQELPLNKISNYSDSFSKATIFPRFEEKLHIN